VGGAQLVEVEAAHEAEDALGTGRATATTLPPPPPKKSKNST